MGEQLSMLDLWMPASEPAPYVPRPRREVLTRAYGRETVLKIDAESPDPVEVEVRGIPCLMVQDYGLSTYALQPPGSLFWSSTGFRSIATRGASIEDGIALVEEHIDTPVKKYGLGGKLERWWPHYITDWLSRVSWQARYDFPGTTMWDQWGPEEQAEAWRAHREKTAALQAQIMAEGYDLNSFEPPKGHTGKWPKFPVHQEQSA